MRNILFIVLLVLLQCFCFSGMAQTSYALKSESYIACPGSKVLLELNEIAGETYSWYTAQMGGVLLSSTSTLTYIKSSLGTDTVWLQVNSDARIPIPIFQSEICGNLIPTACPFGTILFKEDFGGNKATDSFVKASGISQVTDYTFVTIPESGSYTFTTNCYTISKQGHARLNYLIDDHTYPDDITKGYLLQVYAGSTAGKILYKTQLDNLCEGTNLSLSSWLASTKDCYSTCIDSVNLVFLLEKPDGTVLAKYTMKNLPNGKPEWQQYGFNFTVPVGINSIVFKIVNNKTITSPLPPFSFVIDDIEIRSCTPQVKVALSPKSSVCQGENVMVSGDFTNSGYFPEPLEYKWLKSTSGSLLDQTSWSQIATGKTLLLNAVTALDQAYYRLITGDLANIDNLNCRAMSNPVYLEVKTGCAASVVSANNDSIVTLKNKLVLINPFLNDQYTSCEKQDVKISVLQTTLKTKTAILNADNFLVYTPAQDFVGRDSVQYEIECNGLKSTAWCIILVVQEAPINTTTIKNEYVACPLAKVLLEVNAHSGEIYNWYNQQAGGTLLGTGSSLLYTKTTAPVDFVWLQINTEDRIPVCITLSEQCGNTISTTCENGVVLFKEDFGGNNTTDYICKSSGIPQVQGYSYACATSGVQSYTIRKNNNVRDVWYTMDDHTYLNNYAQGYMLVIDANETPGQFYEYQIDNLCAGVHFSFSAWISSLERSSGWVNKTNTVFLLEKLDGTPLIKYYTGNIPDANPVWKQYGFDFTVPAGITSLKLRIINNGDGSAGNDFVMDDIEIRLCIPPVTATISPKENICEGDSVTLEAEFENDGSFTEPLVYKWFKSTNETDWTETGTGQSLIYNPVIQPNNGFYRVAVTSNGGDVDLTTCRSISNSVYMKVNACTALADSICKGENYSFNGKTISAGGIYIDTLATSLGNDSIITLTLTEFPTDTTRIDTIIFSGQSYVFGTETYTSSVKDTLHLKNRYACDSTVILNLLVISLKSQNYIACPGATVVLELNAVSGYIYSWYSLQTGGTLLGSGALLSFSKSTNETDTVWLQINANLRVPVPIYLGAGCGSPFESYCADGTILFKEDFGGNEPTDPDIKPEGLSQVIGYTYNTGSVVTPGSYFIRKEGIHRIVQWYDTDDHTSPGDLTKGYLLQVDANYASGQFYKYDLNGLCRGSHLYFSAWMKSSSRTNMSNKVNTIFLIEKPSGEIIAKYYTGNIPDVDDTWKQYGFDFITPQEEDSLVFRIINNGNGSMGNDFVMDDIEIKLCVPPTTVTILPNDTVCEGEDVSLVANFTNDGSFVEPLSYKWFKSNTGSITNAADWTEIATGQPIVLNDIKQSEQGYYRVAVSSVASIDMSNCRSMSVPVYLKVNTPVDTLLQVNICEGDSYSFNGRTLNSSGIYKDTLISSLGCDSIVTLTLIEIQPVIKEISASICEGNSYSFAGQMISVSGTYKDTLATSFGCDSIIILDLIIEPPLTENITGSFCAGGSYFYRGKTLALSGIYKDTLVTSFGCDSIVTLDLSVVDVDTTYLDRIINQGESYLFGGNTLFETGIYRDTLQNVFGCDSIVILNLSVKFEEDISIGIPEIFTPNNDNKNDFFEIKNIHLYPHNKILIFNRWGNKVWEGGPYLNNWDGTNQFGITVGGNDLPVGTYFYILDLGDGSEEKKGFIYLNR